MSELNRKPQWRAVIGLWLAVAFCLLLQPGHTAQTTVTAPPSRLRLVPVVSDNTILEIVESPDGKRLITYDRAGAPRIWDIATFTMVGVLYGHTDPIDVVKFSPDGQFVVTLSESRIRIWEARRGRLLSTIEVPAKDFYLGAEFSPDSKLLASCTYNGTVYVCTPGLDAKQVEVGSDPGGYIDMAFTPDGKKLLSVGSNGRTLVWDPLNHKQVAKYQEGSAVVRWVEVSPDGKQALLTRMDNKALLIDIDTGKKLFEWDHAIGSRGELPNTLMSALFAGSKKEYVLICTPEGNIDLYNRSDGKLAKSHKVYDGPIREIRISSDGLYIGTYSEFTEGNALKVIDVLTGEEQKLGEMAPDPMAAEFSADSKAFWIGFNDGLLRRYSFGTEKFRQGDFIGGRSISQFRPLLGSGKFWMEFSESGFGFGRSTPVGAFDQHSLESTYSAETKSGKILISTTGKFLVEYYEPTSQFSVRNLNDGKIRFLIDPGVTTTFSQNDLFVGVATYDSTLELFDTSSGKRIASKMAIGSGARSLAISNDGKLAVTDGYEDGFHILDTASGKTIASIPFPVDANAQAEVLFTPSSEKVGILRDHKFMLFDIKENKVVIFTNYGTEQPYELMELSNTGKYFLLGEPSKLLVVDADTGAPIFLDHWWNPKVKFLKNYLSSDDQSIIQVFGNQAHIYGVLGEGELGAMEMVGRQTGAAFCSNDKQILVCDDFGGVNIYDFSKSDKTAKKVGQWIIMQDNSMLVTDTEGRYDATDPSAVRGASYVFEWDGGLEPVEVSQLKSLYYEPNLLQKIFGVSKEPKRNVPALGAIKLYPTIELQPSKKDKSLIEVSLRERDEGGIGKIQVFLNGKQILTKQGTGFFVIDTKQYQPYMLPSSELPEGHGNMLQVVASNRNGDLMSRPQSIDLGVPDKLQAPEAKLYGLFVGAGDYVGSAKDLTAPPKDAEELAATIKRVASNLLPDRVEITVMTTEGQDVRPNREKVLGWFDDVATKANASDIILVFFAGHGTSRIGDQSGYYFLTPDADPSSISPGMVGVSTVSAEDLKAKLTAIHASKQVVILDTCNSGAAADSLLQADRSLGADYARAYESIKDSTGVWLLAGSAADQLSYESRNVEHGMLTYSLLEAIDKASTDGLRSTDDESYFVDIERWMTYAVGRVESLKSEVGVSGIQKPELRRSSSGSTFDVGVLKAENRGMIKLKPPMPVVIFGSFDQDEEDPARLEPELQKVLRGSTSFKLWTDIAKHPNVYRVAGTYTLKDTDLRIRVVVQRFDADQNRKNVEAFEVVGKTTSLNVICSEILTQLDQKIRLLEKARRESSPIE
ncbi:MAG: caspase family protein [Armatimonadetes bacterium]|nr:caspase family protein [Armatimonadota bacterium]